ncbi:tetratricopeptide repeat protein [Brachyspira intermedia]|uniref:tetratricopeptide repeat protein n=1 Tax=Brachyspira intermedia TaxID=84377 RepID=UPI0030056FFF
MKDREIKSTIISLFLTSIFLFALIYFIHAKNVERRFDKILENYTSHLQSITTNNTNIVINLDTKILESSMTEIMKNSNDVLSFWFAFLSVIMIVFTFAGIFINNNILSESKENLEYIENLKKEMEEFKYESKKLISDIDIETQKNINKQQDNINKFLQDINKQYKEISYYIDKEKIHINDTMNSIKNELEKLKLENEKAFDNINKIKDEYSKSIVNIQNQSKEETKKLIEKNNINIQISNLFNWAYQADNNKEYDKAINYYNQIIEMTDDLLKEYDQNSEEYSKYKNNYLISYYNIGNAKINIGYNKEAIEDFDMLIKLNPYDSEAYNNRGNAKSNLGYNKDAIKDFDKSIELNPYDSKVYYNRGNAKNNLGLYEEAIKDFNKAIELNPNSPEAYNNRGIAKKNLGLNEEAIKDFNKAIELNPNSPEAYNNRGISKLYLGNNEEAYNDLIKCYNLSDNISKKEYKQRIIDLARDGFEAAIKICDEKGWKY